jgi:heme exporter protein D
MQDFFYMGGYAFFVGSAYTVVLVVLTANFISPMRRRRRLLREISQQSSRKIINDAETQT